MLLHLFRRGVSNSLYPLFAILIPILYRSSTGIGPEKFAYGPEDVPDNQQQFYQQHGYFITDPTYIQRAEVLESNFYAFRVTGEPKYLERASIAVKSFQTYLNVTTGGFAGLEDVNNTNTDKIDATESYWFAETLKYMCVLLLGYPWVGVDRCWLQLPYIR